MSTVALDTGPQPPRPSSSSKRTRFGVKKTRGSDHRTVQDRRFARNVATLPCVATETSPSPVNSI